MVSKFRPVPPRYPLSPLYEARRIAQDRAEISVAELSRACVCAEQYEADLQRRLESIRQRMAGDAQLVARRAVTSTVFVDELQQSEQYRRASEHELERLTEELNRARLALARQRAAREQARQAAVQAGEALAVVERHRSRFFEDAAKAAEEQAEEQAADNWLARHVAAKAGSE